VSARRAVPIAAWIAVLAVCVAIIARTEFASDLSAFLPRSPSPAQKLLVDQLKDGVISRLILMGIEGESQAALAQLSRAFVDRLSREPHFVYVHNGEQARLKKDWELIFNQRYVLSDAVTAEHFAPAKLREALEANLDLLASPAGPLIEKLIAADPTGEVLHLQEQLEGGKRPAMREGLWFSADGRRALLIAQTVAPGFEMDAQEQALVAIQAAFAQAKTATRASSATLAITGPGVFSVTTRAAIRGDATRLSIIASALVGALLLAVYRSPRVLMVSFLPVITGALAGIATVRAVFGNVHGITLGFGSTLIGEAVDYAVYLFTAVSARESAAQAMTRLWPTLRLGVLTSACGFSAMIFSGFPGLAQLGVFSVAGVVAAVLVTRFVLPQFVPASFAPKTVDSLATMGRALLERAPSFKVPALVLAALAIGFVALRGGAIWNDQLESLSPVSERDKALDGALRTDLGAPDVRHMLIVRAPTEDAALAASEALTPALKGLIAADAIAGFDSPANTLPSVRTQQARRAAIPPREKLEANLQSALADLPYQPEIFAPFLQQASAAHEAPPLTRASFKGTMLSTKIDSLLVARESGWTALLPLREVRDAQTVADEIARRNDGNVVLLDLKRESDALYRGYRGRAMTFALLGALAICGLLLIALRSPRRAYEVLIPLAAAVAVTCAILVAIGHTLTIFDLVALLLVVGVGSNYSLFLDHENTQPSSPERTFISLMLCSVSAAIGFGVLAFSHTPVLNSIGRTVAIGALLSLVFSAILTRRPRNAMP
jgi:predicted exporter